MKKWIPWIGWILDWKDKKQANDLAMETMLDERPYERSEHMAHERLERMERVLMRREERSLWRRFRSFIFYSILIFAGFYWLTMSEAPVAVKDSWKTLTVSEKGSGTAHYPIISIRNEIDGEIHGPEGPTNTVRYVSGALERAEKEKHLVGIILYVESPGGSAASSAQVYEMLKAFHVKTGKPIVAYVPRFAYSGAYYIMCAASTIVAHPAAEVGNIGVIARRTNKYRLGQWLGIDDANVKSGPNKDAFDEWKKPHKGDRRFEQKNIDVNFDLFLHAISDARNIPFETLKRESLRSGSRTSGAWFAASIAKEMQLIDATQTYDEFITARVDELRSKEQPYAEVEFVLYDHKAPKDIVHGFVDMVTRLAISAFNNELRGSLGVRAEYSGQ
jgi:signal peptide peptidase SppA